MSSFETVNHHVETLAPLPPVDVNNPLPQLCTYWKALKPVLALVESFPFFPVKWKSLVTSFSNLLDAICP
jgi:hypothetical protein